MNKELENIYSKEARHYLQKDKEYYPKAKNMNFFQTYRDNRVEVLKRVYNLSEEKALEITRSIMKKHLKVPILQYYERDPKTRDKKVSTGDLLSYISGSIRNDEILLPNFSRYEKYGMSLDAGWTVNKTKERNYYKNLMKKAEQEGDLDGQIRQNKNQQTKKVAVNGLSGHSALINSPLHTLSYHNALTATTRVTTSSGNHRVERIIGGNRNWLDEDDAIEDIIMYNTCFVEEDVRKAVEQFNMKIPTNKMIREFVFDKMYNWNHESRVLIGLTKLQRFIRNMSDMEKVFLFYGEDFTVLSKYNNEFFRKWLIDFTGRSAAKGESKDMSVLHNASYNMQNAIYTINTDLMTSSKLNFDTYKDSHLGDILIGTYRNMQLMLKKYEYFIKAFFTNIHVQPRRLGKIKFMLKTGIQMSDTDSVVLTCHNLLRGTMSKDIMSANNIRQMAPLVLFVSERIQHAHNTFTTLTNAKEENHSKIAMKSEFIWSVFIAAPVAKTYTVSAIMQEFFSKATGEIGVSGVHLIAGDMRKELKVLYDDFKLETIRELEFNGQYHYPNILKRAARLEARVIGMLKKHPSSVLPIEKIKPAEEYAKFTTGGVRATPYFHYDMYLKYYKHLFNNREIDSSVPFLTCKIFFNSNDDKQDLLNEGLEYFGHTKEESLTFEHPALAYKKEKKSTPSSIRIPLEIVMAEGLPPSWLENLDVKETLNRSIGGLYKFLESLGIGKTEDKTFMTCFGR